MTQPTRKPFPPRSVSEVVEHLGQEFEGWLSVRAVTDVVMRLSRNGAVSLPVLAEMARSELSGLIAPDAGRQAPGR